jgi:Zn-dependent peptidase ImmA (M78 family)/DNA-binding XRE family transcriptional regulator
MRIGIENFRPERLALARHFRIKTKKEVAESIGASQSTLTKWEDGTHKPEQRHLADLAWTLDFPVEWFTSSVTIGASNQRHRSNKSSLKRQKLRMSATLSMMDGLLQYLDNFVDLPGLEIPQGGWKSAASIHESDIVEAAEAARQSFQFDLGPAGDVVDAMEAAGVAMAKCSVGGTQIDGVSAWSTSTGRPLVLLATDKASAARRRFDAAHELAHLILHRDIKPSNFENEDEEDAYFDMLERQADDFASEFLLPSQSFANELRFVHLDEFADLKLKWRTSIKMMIYKAKKMDIIDAEYAKHLYIMYNTRGWNRQEPHDHLLAMEEPDGLRSALTYVVGDSSKSMYELQARTGLNQSILEEVFDFTPSISAQANVVLFQRPTRPEND